MTRLVAAGLRCCSVCAAGVAASELSRNLELRCVLAVIRHGDRTPKQKMKVTVTQVRVATVTAVHVNCQQGRKQQPYDVIME